MKYFSKKLYRNEVISSSYKVYLININAFRDVSLYSLPFNDLIKFSAFAKNFKVKLTLTEWKRKMIVLVTMRHWQFHSI